MSMPMHSVGQEPDSTRCSESGSSNQRHPRQADQDSLARAGLDWGLKKFKISTCLSLAQCVGKRTFTVLRNVLLLSRICG